MTITDFFSFSFSGTMLASYQLVKQLGGVVLGCVVLYELTELDGTARVPCECFSLLKG